MFAASKKKEKKEKNKRKKEKREKKNYIAVVSTSLLVNARDSMHINFPNNRVAIGSILDNYTTRNTLT
jgi:hypothetical protein